MANRNLFAPKSEEERLADKISRQRQEWPWDKFFLVQLRRAVGQNFTVWSSPTPQKGLFGRVTGVKSISYHVSVNKQSRAAKGPGPTPTVEDLRTDPLYLATLEELRHKNREFGREAIQVVEHRDSDRILPSLHPDDGIWLSPEKIRERQEAHVAQLARRVVAESDGQKIDKSTVERLAAEFQGYLSGILENEHTDDHHA